MQMGWGHFVRLADTEQKHSGRGGKLASWFMFESIVFTSHEGGVYMLYRDAPSAIAGPTPTSRSLPEMVIASNP